MKDPDLTHYKNLSEFFYRELKDGARPIDFDAALVGILLNLTKMHDILVSDTIGGLIN